MHSRAYMLLEREYILLQKQPAWGIEAHPLNEDNFFEWTATIQGLKDTLWEGGYFVVSLKFCEKYNDEPPLVHFHTIPFHPNIDMTTGRPCIDFLDDVGAWTAASHSLHSILLSLQFMLSNPVVEEAINVEATNIFTTNPDLYKHIVIDCVNASQQLLGDKSMARYRQLVGDQSANPPTGNQNNSRNLDEGQQQLSRLSFDEYLTTWTGIATSKPQSNMKNPLLEAIKNDSKLQAAHFGLTLEDLKEQMKEQLNKHNQIMFGKFGKKHDQQDAQNSKFDHINKMKKIYLPRRNAPPPTAVQSEVGELWERDVENLVDWTNNLDEEDLEF